MTVAELMEWISGVEPDAEVMVDQGDKYEVFTSVRDAGVDEDGDLVIYL